MQPDLGRIVFHNVQRKSHSLALALSELFFSGNVKMEINMITGRQVINEEREASTSIAPIVFSILIFNVLFQKYFRLLFFLQKILRVDLVNVKPFEQIHRVILI